MRRWVCSGLLAATTVFAATTAHGATLHMLSQLPDGTVVSNNWSGYAVTGDEGSVTRAAASWIVPVADCNNAARRNTGASFWVGIDGYNSATVEQAGTDSDCSKASPKYYAWYEYFPKGGITIRSIAVNPGDVMAASITYDGAIFRLKITDKTTSKSFSVAKANPKAKRNSAEWIAEDNSRHFTDFETASFGLDNTGVNKTCKATVDGVTNPIGVFPKYHTIQMETRSGRTLALPSALSADGTSFSVRWH